MDIPTEIKIPTNLDTELESDDDDDDELTEEEELKQKIEDQKKDSEQSKQNLLSKVLDDDNKPAVWGDTEEDEDVDDDVDKDDVDDLMEPSSDDYHDSDHDAYVKKITSDKKMMDITESFAEDSEISKPKKADISKDLSEKPKPAPKDVSPKKEVKKFQPPAPVEKQKEKSETTDQYDDDDFLPEDYGEDIEPIQTNKMKQMSSAWDPRKEKEKMNDRIQTYLKDKEKLTKEEQRLAEQEMIFNKDQQDDSRFSDSKLSSKNSSFVDTREDTKLKRHSPETKLNTSKHRFEPLEVIREDSIPQREESQPFQKVFIAKKTGTFREEPEPKVDEKGNLKMEFQEKELPELDTEILAAIRDQLLLQKMYKNDLENFKKFKKTQKGKKKKGASKAAGKRQTHSRRKFK